MARKADFQRALEGFFQESIERGYPNRDLKARELHFRGAHEYPRRGNNRVRQCCAVMKEAMRAGDKILPGGPAKGEGTRFEIRYKLPRIRFK